MTVKIIYIPFYEPNDLECHAYRWNTKSQKYVVVHNQVMPLNLSDVNNITVYVLAHGISGDRLTHDVANSTSGQLRIDISEIANRFQQQFFPLQKNITKIKLFMCNDKNTEKKMALRFLNFLTGFDNTTVDYYKGNLIFPNILQPKVSEIKGFFYPLKSVRQSLFPIYSEDGPMVDADGDVVMGEAYL